MRLMLRCGRASRFPSVIDAADNTAIRSTQLTRDGSRVTTRTRTSAAKPAALDPTDRNAATGVGAPS